LSLFGSERVSSILFVCLGNICRSPLAEGIAVAHAKECGFSTKIDSAGTGSWHIGEVPCENSIRVAKERGVDIAHLKARQVTTKDPLKFDHIIALDQKNRADLEALGWENVRLLGEFGFEGADVPDPYFFEGFEGFDKVYDMIETGVRNLFDELDIK